MWETTSLATIKLVITTAVQNVGAVKVLPNMRGNSNRRKRRRQRIRWLNGITDAMDMNLGKQIGKSTRLNSSHSGQSRMPSSA